MEKKIINNKIELIRREDQIYIYRAINKCTLDMETIKAMTKAGDEWNGNALCANLLDIRDMIFASSEVRSYGAKQYRPHVVGMAILTRTRPMASWRTDSRLSNSFANLYLKFSKPKIPTKLFNSETEAINWLKRQMEMRK